MAKFRMKNEPVKPIRGRIEKITTIWDGMSLSELLEYVPCYLDPSFRSSIEIEGEYDYECRFYWSRDKTDEEFDLEMAVYETKLAEYKLWYEENKEEIEERLAAEKAKKEAMEKKKKEIQDKLAARAEEKERKTYERLKKKYG